jgi:hypothetical protein
MINYFCKYNKTLIGKSAYVVRSVQTNFNNLVLFLTQFFWIPTLRKMLMPEGIFHFEIFSLFSIDNINEK